MDTQDFSSQKAGKQQQATEKTGLFLDLTVEQEIRSRDIFDMGLLIGIHLMTL